MKGFQCQQIYRRQSHLVFTLLTVHSSYWKREKGTNLSVRGLLSKTVRSFFNKLFLKKWWEIKISVMSLPLSFLSLKDITVRFSCIGFSFKKKKICAHSHPAISSSFLKTKVLTVRFFALIHGCSKFHEMT